MANDTTDTVKDDPVARYILESLAGGVVLSPQDIAKAYGENKRKPKDKPDFWRRYMQAVKQQALHLARQGRIEIVRDGKPVDIEDFRGLVKLRLPE